MDSPSDSLSKSLPLDRNRELLKTAQEEVYKRVGDQDLRAYLWEPPGGKAPDYPRSAAAFFFQQWLGSGAGGAVCAALRLLRLAGHDHRGL